MTEKLCISLAQQIPVHALIITSGCVPGVILAHAPIHHLVPVGLVLKENVLGIVDDVEQFLAVVVGEGESVSRVLELVVWLNRILQASGLPDDGHRAVAEGNQLRQSAGSNLDGIRNASAAA